MIELVRKNHTIPRSCFQNMIQTFFLSSSGLQQTK